MINRQKIQSLLIVISATLSAVREHPVFEQAVECDSYYTMNDLTLDDAIQALNEIVDGMECTNSSDIEVLEKIPEGPLEECLKASNLSIRALEVGLVVVSTRFTKLLWKKLSSQYRCTRKEGCRMHRTHLIALDDEQFKTAQRLIREVFGDEIDTHEIKDEF